MPNKTCLPQTASQTSGGKYQTFTNLNNIKKKAGYAECHVHAKKQPLNRPSTITVKKFVPSLPTGALATKVTVKIKHSKAPVNKKNCNVTAPTVTLMNGNSAMKYTKSKKAMSKKLKAPTTTAKEYSVTFKHNWNFNELNTNDFGVKIDYPTNSNDNEGLIRIYYVQVIIEYRTANFTLTSTQTSGEYNGDEYAISLTANNINNVKSIPTVTIDAPLGFSLKDYGGKGTFTIVSPRTFSWKPALGLNKGSDTVHLLFDTNVSFSGSSESITLPINAEENITKYSHTKNVTVLKTRPVDPIDITPPDDDENKYVDDDSATPTGPTIITAKPNQNIIPELELPTDVSNFTIHCCKITDGDFDNWDLTNLSFNLNVKIGILWYMGEGEVDFTSSIDAITVDYNSYDKVNNVALVITAKNSTEPIKVIYVDIAVNTDTPSFSVLKLSQEELNRLGHGYTYTAETMMKLTTNEKYVRDWNNNFRIAVFNNAITENISKINIPNEEGEYETIVVDSTDYECLTPQDIFNYADYWSPKLTKVNEYSSIEVKFPYNKDYPVYIIVVGDSDTLQAGIDTTVKFTEPIITETDYYNGRIANGNYPTPILELIGDETSSEISINELEKAETLIFYDFPLHDDFGTDENIVIRGLAVQGITDSNTDNLRLTVSLVNNKNESKQRSIILDEFDSKNYTDNEFTIGQVGDLWGFKTTEIKNLEDWEFHMILNNVLNNFTANANIGEIRLIVYYEEIVEQKIKCYIEGEDIGYYGAFIQNVTIPEGLKTETDYITVDGTDTNNPYRQNIRGKTIEIEFDIGDGCDLEGATLSLNELKRLLTNKRDKYNRPIPKRIEFSHYPDVFWEYVMEDPIDADIEISSYNCKVKLEIPAGTSYDKEVTSTAETGFVSGLANIPPIIQVVPTDSVLSIVETQSKQEFNMGYGGNWKGKIVEIDCEDRIVWLKESDDDEDPTNISSGVDINSDWFILYGEYEFQSAGCVIRAVNWQERW